MSDEAEVVQVFAIDNSRPPEAWVSDWVMYRGMRVSGSDVPSGFRQVEQDEYLEALSYQKSANDSLQSSAIDSDEPNPDQEPID